MTKRREILEQFRAANQLAIDEWEAMLAEQEKLGAILGTGGDGVITADLESRILIFSPGAEQLLGWTEEEVLGKSLTILMPEKYRAHHIAGMAHFKATGETRIMDRWLRLEALRKDGKIIPLELKISAFQTTARWVGAVIRNLSLPAEELTVEHRT